MKATRHNGRSGKNGTYNPRHNDRRFDLENSEHIDAGRVRENIYWDCYRGYTTMQNREEDSQDISFEKIECTFYQEHYGKYIEAQNERNARTRHTERNRSVEDLLKNNKTCPEETIFQIGTVEESVSYEILLAVVQDFTKQFTNRFGSHVHILDWALHLDEGTPHIHERHVFDCENKYGEICPQQEKALEELGIALPKPDKPKGRNNNRKQTFDAICRTMLFDITRKYGLHLEEEPSYGGRDYLEKQDYILFKQKEQMKNQTEILDTLTLKIEEVEALIDEVSDIAYDKAVEVVTDEVRVGNCLPLENIPVGTQIHNIELLPGKGGQLVRSAGLSAQLMAKEGKYATLRLPSGEMRMVPIQCRATIGVIGNGDHNLVNIGKAGRKRHMGVRPTVRGSVMNPNDHPHGGGEGKAPVGRPGPCTPWGKPALGLKTRKKNKQSNKMIVRRRDGRAIK